MCLDNAVPPRKMTGWCPGPGEGEWDWVDIYLLKEWKLLKAMHCDICGRLYVEHYRYPSPSSWQVMAEVCPGGTERERVREADNKRPNGAKQCSYIVYPVDASPPVLEYEKIKR